MEGYEWERIAYLISQLVHKNKNYFFEFLVLERKKVDVEQFSKNARDQLIKLSAVSITAQQLQSATEKRLMLFPRFKAYFTLGLGNFSVLPTEQLTIDGTTYPIDQLFQEISKDKVSTFFGLSRVAANQYLKLIDANIYVDKVRTILLTNYWDQLRSMLDKDFVSLPSGANNLSIRDKSIKGFDTLFSNRSRDFDQLADEEQTLLRDAILNQENSPTVAEIKRKLRLLRGDIISPITPEVPTKQPPTPPVKNSETNSEDVQNQAKNDSEQTTSSTKTSKQKTKVSKSKTLTITLASVGGTAVLAGVSGFVYWFIKLRK